MVAIGAVLVAGSVARADGGRRAAQAPVPPQHGAAVSDRGAQCVLASDPVCGVCAVACNIGQSAVCTPGIKRFVDHAGHAECVKQPVCRCDGADGRQADTGGENEK